VEESAKLAERFARLIGRGEIEEANLCAPDAQGWHNTDELWAPMTEAPARMAFVRTIVPDFHAVDIVSYPWPGGFAVEYVFVGTSTRGEKIRIVGCVVATVAGGLITRVKEYVDSAHASAILAALAG
jgi:ketosteroid isomerase-like protein